MSGSTFTNRFAASKRFTKPKPPAEYNLPLFIETLKALLVQMVIEKTSWECRDITDSGSAPSVKFPFYKTQGKLYQNTWVNTGGMNRSGPQGMLLDLLSDELIENIVSITLAWRAEKSLMSDPDKRKSIKTNSDLVLFIENIIVTTRDISAVRYGKNPHIIDIPIAPNSNMFYSIFIQSRLSAKIP